MFTPPQDPMPAQPIETDLWLPHAVFAPLQRIVRAAIVHFDEIDPSILRMDAARLGQLEQILDNGEDDGETGGRNLRLTNIDLASFEHLSLYAEEFFADLGGENDLQMVPPDITALSEKLRHYYAIAFPGEAGRR